MSKRNITLKEKLTNLLWGVCSSLIASILFIILVMVYRRIFALIYQHEQTFQLYLLISIFLMGVILVILTILWLYKKSKNRILHKAIPIILLCFGVMLVFNSLHISFFQPQQSKLTVPVDLTSEVPLEQETVSQQTMPEETTRTVISLSAEQNRSYPTLSYPASSNSTALSSQEFVVAVAHFSADSDSSYTSDELSNITELFIGFLSETKSVKVVTRSQWDAILGEHEFQRSGLVEKSEIRQKGKALGAQAIITGKLMKVGNNNILNLSLLDIESGVVLAPARRTFVSLDDFMNLLPALAADIVKRLKAADDEIKKEQ